MSRPIRHCMLSCFLGTTVVGAVSSGALAQEKPADPFTPFVYVGVVKDDNVFRVASSDEMLPLFGTDNTGSTITRIEAGFSSEVLRTQHQFLIDTNVYRQRIKDFSDFDHTGGRADVEWNWKSKSGWQTSAGYRFDRRLRDFREQAIPSPNPRTENRLSAAISTLLAPQWQLKLDGSVADIAFDDSAAQDHERLSGGIALTRRTRAGSSINVVAEASNATFNMNALRDYNEFSAGPGLVLNLTDHTRLSASLRYTRRDHDSELTEDFGGLTGHLTLSRLPRKTGTGFEMSVFRRIQNLPDDFEDYAITTGVRAELNRRVTDKLRIRLSAERERRDFESERQFELVTELRADDVLALQFKTDWQATESITLSAVYTNEQRDSNRMLREYEFQSIGLSVQARF